MFTKHNRFNKFVRDFANERIKAKLSGNKGRETFCKTSLNGSYGYDGMNQMKYNKNVLKDRESTFIAQMFDNFIDTRKVSENKYVVAYRPKYYKEETCLQCSFFTLDNSKFWYLNYYYNFMCRCLDMDRIHVIELDTDSLYCAIAGNPDKDYHQRYDYVIKDKKYYDEHVYEWFPNPDKDIFDSDPERAELLRLQDEKKLLGVAIEKEGENCVALTCKCYTIWNNDGSTKSLKLKGISLKKNNVQATDYEDALMRPKKGININLQLKNDVISKLTITKNGLSGVMTKAYVLPNQCCAALGFDKYYVL